MKILWIPINSMLSSSAEATENPEKNIILILVDKMKQFDQIGSNSFASIVIE